ncbi:MAG: beta strand repeat-containing protein, partial [Tepidisphaerales bacterium]
MGRVYSRCGRRSSAGALRQAVCEAMEERRLLSTIYVDVNAPGPARDGTSWGNAYADLQLALGAAVSGDTIRVAEGTYKPTSGTDRNKSFVMKTGVGIYGGYAGYGAGDPDARGVAAYPSILSGDIGTTGSNTDNSYYVIGGSGTTSTAVLDGFTITAGCGSSGAGMYNYSGSPTIRNCTFIGNSGTSNGGGMCNTSSSPTLINCTFGGNSAPYGGGMYNSSSNPTLVNCTFSANCASDSGNAMYNDSFSSPKLTNCIIWGSGNAPLYNNGSTPVITFSDIQGGCAGAGNISTDPMFIRSPWTGPDGRFGTADDDYGDQRLRFGSPVLNMGLNAAIPTGVTTDLAGNARIQNGTVDLGAYEGPTSAPAPTTIYVDMAAVGANTGTSWTDAFSSLQPAVLTAVDGDTIRIAHGTYKPTGTTDRTIGFALRNAVVMYGGYAGYGAPNPDTRDMVAYPTLLSGDIGQIGDASDNSYHVVTASGVGSSTVLDGVTVIGGNANGSGANQSTGGGLFATGSSPTVTNCAFRGNSANGGGGIYNAASASPTLANCTFTGNTASSSGGAMSSDSSNPTLINCTFSGNYASTSGAALYNTSSSSPKLTNCIIWGSGNSPIINNSSTPTIGNSDVQGGYDGYGNIAANPLFVRSPWTGPDGLAGTADDDYGDLRLQPGSPALDIGANAAVPAGVTTDLAGNARIQNGRVDLGAYEGPTSVPAPKTIYVDPAAVGANTGTTWSDAFSGLQPALLVATDGDTIRIAHGTCKPTSTTDRTIGFALRNAVAVYGGYAGYGASNPNVRDIVAYPTILSGDIGKAGDTSDNSYHVLTATGVGPSTILDGVTVTGAKATGSGSTQSYGGGLREMASSPTLSNCIFSGNSALYDGAGIYSTAYSSPTLTNCTFSGNSSSWGAGAYNTAYSSPTFTNCTFSGNSVSSCGGGMYDIASSSPTLANCTFIGNSASSQGGGMYNDTSSSPTLTNCVFSRNMTTDAGSSGGGMYDTISSSPALNRCTFTGNSAPYGGGMYNGSSSSPTLTNCTFSGNSASNSGGGMYNNSSASPALVNCTFSGNSAINSGGMYNNQSSAPTLANCILWGNTAAVSSQLSGSPSVTYSDIQGGFAGTGNINSDPIFVRNPSPGTDATWGTADDDYGDLRLRPTSPAIDAGNNAAIPSGITTDLAGNPRRQNVASVADTGSGYPPIVDMGAFEVKPGPLAISGGSYSVVEGCAVTLNGVGYGERGVTLSYAWDFDADGLYDDATGSNASFSASGMVGPQARAISLRVTDSAGVSAFDTATVTIVHPLYVDDTATGTNDGSSWTNACQSLQTALAAATAGQTILVGQGTYKPTTTNNRSVSFALKTGVAIYGGYAGVDAADPYARDVHRYASVLSGDIGIAGTNADNSYHVVVASGTTASAVLDGFTITGGNANAGSSPNNTGGGIYNVSGSPSIRNCTLSGNAAYYIGGGMCNTGTVSSPSAPALTNCVLVGNTASASGGGIYDDSFSWPALVNCTLSGNTGAGIYSQSGSTMPVLTNCILWGNTGGQVSGVATATYSDIQNSWAGTGNINADPLFVRNPSAGADGKWGTADDDYGDLRLGSLTSPAVDAGNNAAVPSGVTTDLGGNPRFADVPQKANTGSGTPPIVDMGAYERSPAAGTIGGTSGDDSFCLRLSADQTTLDVFSGLVAAGQPTATYALQSYDAFVSIDTGAGNDKVVFTGFSAADTLNIQATQMLLNSIIFSTSNIETMLLDAPAGSALSLAALTISRPVALVAGKNLTLRVGSLDITGAGSLDLAGNSMILDYSNSPMTQVRGWISNGRLGVTPALKTSGSVFSGTPALGMVDNS